MTRSNSQRHEYGLRQGLGDLVALVRCGRLSAALPAAAVFGWRIPSVLTRTYNDVVAPVVERTVSDLGERTRVNRALRAMSVNIGMVMLYYTRLAGGEQRLEVTALAGAVTRLYDDLVDCRMDASLDDRLGDLLSAGPLTAHTDAERLLAELVSEIRQRVGTAPGDTCEVALTALHEYQCLSRRQREDSVPLTVLDKICRGKGAMAHLTLCSLVNPELDADEKELVMSLGEAFQSLDDYMDVEADTHNGVVTLASLGATTLMDIGLRMRVLSSHLITRYGRTAARPYRGMIFFLLLKAAVGRRLPVLGRIVSRLAGQSATLTFLTRGAEAVAAAPGDRRGP